MQERVTYPTFLLLECSGIYLQCTTLNTGLLPDSSVESQVVLSHQINSYALRYGLSKDFI